MKKEITFLVERYLNFLRFKKFMIFYVMMVTLAWAISIYFLVDTIIEGEFIFKDSLWYVVVDFMFYVGLRVFQEFCIAAGAEDRYDFFFNRRGKKK